MTGRLLGAALLSAVAVVAVAPLAAAQDAVARVDWASTAPLSGEVVDGNVRVSADQAGGAFRLVTIEAPDLGRVGYDVRGRVRYSDVGGTGYLEMWSVFADGSRYFTRTLGSEGPMAALTGTSDWREFELPFSLQGSEPPAHLEIGVTLPAGGTVDVGPLELVRLDGETSGAWLSERAVGVAGAIVGTTIGLLAAVMAVLVGRQRGRRFVLPLMTAAAAVGVGLIVLAVVAVATGQPQSVILLLLVTGLVLAVAFGISIPRTRRLFAEAELRKMRAMDRA